MASKRYLIIGHSAAGLTAARTLRKLDPLAVITIVTEEQEYPYNKCFIADYVGGAKPAQAVMTGTAETLALLDIVCMFATKVVAIESDNKKVMVSSGEYISYDKLLLATGSSSYMPPIKVLQDAQPVIPFATLADAQRVLDQMTSHPEQKVIVLGAGLSGLEIADALLAHKAEVTVIEQGEYVLARHVTPQGGATIAHAMQQAGVKLYVGIKAVEIKSHDAHAISVVLSDGTELWCTMVVVAAGVRQNTHLALQAGIACDAYGIVVNEYMQTSVPTIYAAGDVIGVMDRISSQKMASCTWPDAMQQGMHAAYAMCDMPKPYMGADVIVSSAFFGLKFASCGSLAEVVAEHQIVERCQQNMYHRYLLCDGVLKGFITIGAHASLPKMRRALLTGEPIELE